MLRLPKSARVFLATSPIDMRKQMDGLSVAVREGLGREPHSGELFVFRNRRGDMVRVLFHDQQGYCLLSKRLDRGTFTRVPSDGDASSLELAAEELAKFLTAGNPWERSATKAVASSVIPQKRP